MSPRTAPIQFDLTTHYILSEAFFRVGLAMYPDTWSGLEQFAAPVSDIEAIKARKVALEDEYQRYTRQARALALLDSSGLDHAEFEKHMAQQENLANKALEARNNLHRIRGRYESKYIDDATWQRRLAVENRLCTAFARNELTLICGASCDVIWKNWSQEKDFYISFVFSLIYAPRSKSGRRKNTAHVRKDKFDIWYATQSDFSSDGIKRSKEDRIKSYFAAATKSHSAPPKKLAFTTELRDKFSPMSQREAARHWDSFAPDSWKVAGPKTRS
ncbi:hypothetical protein KDD17_04910 [Sulfitobacter albidus]|uniref:Uncharacterized protein n=1 Tax=Sulfitobacter albidus TaxID=2829501 RepID=A0A975PNI5_9RHOB|nr:hypothetical protein [Sulfitobacter albidus]QUJ77345.1 hypothetical protein KDD17_04910 [Sulfitobacter albidus]